MPAAPSASATAKLKAIRRMEKLGKRSKKLGTGTWEIPSSKSQIPNKSQIPKIKTAWLSGSNWENGACTFSGSRRFGFPRHDSRIAIDFRSDSALPLLLAPIEIWSLGFVWDLRFGIWDFSG